MNKKAIIFDIQRASVYDGPGIRTTIFLKGCPLKCMWCHNPESQSFSDQLFYYYDKCTKCTMCHVVCENNVHEFIKERHKVNFNLCKACGKCVEECNTRALKISGTKMSIGEVMSVVEADKDFYQNSNGGVTISGGEPLAQISFVKHLLKKCKSQGINTCIETSGYVPSVKFKKILSLVDILLFDYKITGAENHKKYTGVSNELILENLDIAYQSGVPIVLRCPVIPGINDTVEHFKGIRELELKYPNLKGIELLPYHSIGNSKRKSIGLETTLPELSTISAELKEKWMEKLKELKCTKVKFGWD